MLDIETMNLIDVRYFEEKPNANKDTHTHKGYIEAHKTAMLLMPRTPPDLESFTSIDLFARKCQWGDIRNDLNPIFQEKGFTNSTCDALELISNYEGTNIDLIFFDPPFSSRMADDKYDDVGSENLYTNPRYMSDLGKSCFMALKPGGLLIKAGFNSNPPARGFDMIALYISSYGASRNDVLFTIWKKVQSSIMNF